MISNWVFWISARYISVKKRGRRISAGFLSAVGIAVGVAALITVISVMNGFQMGFIEDILEISSCHIRVKGIDLSEAEKIRKLPGVKSVMPFIESQSLINTEYSMEPCIIKGIPAEAGILDPGFMKQLNITRGQFEPEKDDGVLIGRIMAYRMGVAIGDHISLIAMNGDNFSKMRPEEQEFEITGFFQSGYNDFDSALIIMLYDSLSAIDDTSKPVFGVKLDNRFSDGKISGDIASIPGITTDKIDTWRSYNQSFFSALKLEKTMMFFLLGLIFLVVSFGIYNSTSRTVAEKQEEIGIMRALGSTPTQIRQIFILDGVIIGLTGGIVGTVVGLLASVNVNNILSFFALSSSSFLVNVPVRIVFSEVLSIFIAAMSFCIISALAASRKVSRITPQEVLRYE